MTTIILTNRLRPLERFLKDFLEPFRYLNLEDTPESHRVMDFLQQSPKATELPRAELNRQRSESFRKTFAEFLGQVNVNHGTRHWWAMSFTNKYSLGDPLCRNTFDFLLIVDLLRTDTRPLLVVTGSRELVDQLAEWARSQNLPLVNTVRRRLGIKGILKEYTPAGPARAIFQTVALWVLSRHLKPRVNKVDGHLLIATHTHLRSFSGADTYQDVYFGPLVDQASGVEANAVIMGLIHERPFAQLGKLKKLRVGIPVTLPESSLPLKSLLVMIWEALRFYLKPIQPKPESTEGRPWGQPLKKLEGAPLNLG